MASSMIPRIDELAEWSAAVTATTMLVESAIAMMMSAVLARLILRLLVAIRHPMGIVFFHVEFVGYASVPEDEDVSAEGGGGGFVGDHDDGD